MATRPELVAPPEVFYNDEEARKYTSNSHMIDTQARRGRAWALTAMCVLRRLMWLVGTGAADAARTGVAGAAR